MLGLNENTLATLVLLVFVVYMCMHSTSALQGKSRNAMTGNVRRCHSCGFSVEHDQKTCPHCSAKLEHHEQGRDVLA